MLNKRYFSSSYYEIHLYAIDEGTGHLQRMYNIACYLKTYFSNISIIIYNIYNNNYIKEYIKKNKLKKIFHYKYFSDNHKNLSTEKLYILILDIRDHNPKKIIKFYKNSKYFVLCIDNHYKNKNKSFYYWYTLPHPDLKFSMHNLIYQNFWNPEYIKILNTTKTIKKNNILIYLGFTEHIYVNFLKQPHHIESLVLAFGIKDISSYTLYFIDKDTYFTFDKFYKLLQKSNIVITYPGLLLYESIILKKKVICYDLNSFIHYKILKKIRQKFKDQFIDSVHLNFNNHVLNFYNFDFSNILNSFNVDNQEKLWTSYHTIKNWIENHIN